jgi:xylulose-5-phosphate/fructose-6-phosphate phosphoketolase
MTQTETGPLTRAELDLINAWWRAANYLSAGQIYLLDNPLLAEPLRPEHVKPRLLGHWGTTPGLNLIYAHLNRVIRNWDLDVIYVAGPGHGGPGMVANTYLEGTYTELYPAITQDTAGIRQLFRQFSFPGGIPSHVAPETPGSIHEGGELGYSLAHAYGAAFDNPDLLVACVIGDGEAETGPLAASWHSNKFLDPARDGAVLPILHLNGYKIANPTVLARIPDEELESLLRGYGYQVHTVSGDDPEQVHQRLAAVMDTVVAEIHAIRRPVRILCRLTSGSRQPCRPVVTELTATPFCSCHRREIWSHQALGMRGEQCPLPRPAARGYFTFPYRAMYRAGYAKVSAAAFAAATAVPAAGGGAHTGPAPS